jgi:hypothetical protein
MFLTIYFPYFLRRPDETINNPQNRGVSMNKIGGKRGEIKRI